MSDKVTFEQPTSAILSRRLGFWQTVLWEFGSIVGAGIFVCIGITAGVANSAVILAMSLAAMLAIANGLVLTQVRVGSASSNIYGLYPHLSPWLQFAAGWTFLLAKVTSAAASTLGVAVYLLYSLGQTEPMWVLITALLLLLLFTLLLQGGRYQSGLVLGIAVTIALLSLLFLIAVGLPHVALSNAAHFTGRLAENPAHSIASLLQASALMVVAYAGYECPVPAGRRSSARWLVSPHALTVTLLLILMLYVGVAIVAVGVVGSASLDNSVQAYEAPLSFVAFQLHRPAGRLILTVGAIAAMSGILYHLMAVISQVLQAMGQQRDIPKAFAQKNTAGAAPIALSTTGVVIACIVFMVDFKAIWSFSAFTILLYYALAHWAILQLPPHQRHCPRGVVWLSLIACLFLAFWIDWQIWLLALGLIAIGILWRSINRWANEPPNTF